MNKIIYAIIANILLIGAVLSFSSGTVFASPSTGSSSGSCSGVPTITLSPNPTGPFSVFEVTVGGLSGCSGTTVYIKTYQGCSSGSTVASFNSGSSGGSAYVVSPSTSGHYGYWACVNGKGTKASILVSAAVTSTTTASTSTTSTLASSATTTAASCSGSPTVSMSPSPASPSSSVEVSVGGLSNCNGTTVQIKSYEGCQSGSTLASFVSGSSGGSASLTSPDGIGSYGYWICVNNKGTEATLTTTSQSSNGNGNSSGSTLGFAIYTTNSTFLSQYENYYSNAGSQSILEDDSYLPNYRVYLQYWSSPQTFPRMIFGNNYTELTKNVADGFSNIGLANQYDFNSNDYITYDAESWAKTPSWEQDDQSYWLNQICTAVHNAGYKCGWTPELGGGPGAGQFENINWTNVDFVGLLEQGRSVSTSGWGNLTANVTHLTSIARNGNPNIKVWVYLDISTNPIGQKATTSQLESDITQMGQIKGVDGVVLVCQPGCNTNEMTTLVNYIKSTPNDP